MRARIVGQDEAVTAVSQAVRRNRAGMGDPNRPVGSFLFLGPTGVGKTELAKTLAELLFGDDERMVRFDMSEFQEKHTVARLVGAPPGYVGYDEAYQPDREGAAQPLQRGAVRRGREGAPRRLQHTAPDPRRRPASRTDRAARSTSATASSS